MGGLVATEKGNAIRRRWPLHTTQKEQPYEKCPYSLKVRTESHPFGFGSYCGGDSLTGLWMPNLFEETPYCITLQYPACRVFQAW
jgi:hypothetical protein